MAEIRRLLDDGVVTPPAAQRPFPIWLGYQGPQGARRAGRLGVGLLSLDRRLLEPYREGLVEGGHDPASARTGGMLDIVVADDPEATLDRILPHYLHQANTYAECAVAGTGVEPRVLTAEKVMGRSTTPGQVPGLRVLTPDDAVAAIREATDGPRSSTSTCGPAWPACPDDVVDRHVELLCTQVAPALTTS